MYTWPSRHQRLVLAAVLKNCRLGSSLSSILLKNNILNSFKLLEYALPLKNCVTGCLALLYSLSFPNSITLGLLHAFSCLFQATAVSNFPSQMHRF